MDHVINSSLSLDLSRDEELARAEITVLAAIFVVTVFGNTTVLIAIYTRRYCVGNKKLPRMYFFILHLSVADLSTGVLNVLPQLCWEVTYRFHGGPILCKAVKFGQTLGPYLSSYVLVVTALDRYKAICTPLSYSIWTSHQSSYTLMSAWMAALVFCLPQAVIFSYQEVGPGVWDCWASFPGLWGERMYVTWYSVSVFLVPLCTLVYTYSHICWTLWRYAGLPDGSSPHRLISRAKLNTVKQTVAIILLYVACSSPFITAQLWATWNPHQSFIEGAGFTILTLLSSLNSCVNPWIYLWFNKEMVRSLWQVSGCVWSPQPRPQNNRGSNSRRVTEVTTTADPQDEEGEGGAPLKTFRSTDSPGAYSQKCSKKPHKSAKKLLVESTLQNNATEPV